jgi:AcrR family transcriptional regulator
VKVKAGEAAAIDVSATNKRSVGRPRRPSTDDKILRATLELLQQGGPNAVTIDAIAERCGSAKTTIYRRWPSLESLIVDALRVAVRARLDQVDEIHEFDDAQGSPIRGAARQILNLVNESLFQSSFPMMARILLGDRVLGDRFRAEVFAPLRAVRRGELLEMQANGQLRQDMDPDLVLDLVFGAILYRALMAGRLDEEVADEIADIVSRSFELTPSAIAL